MGAPPTDEPGAGGPDCACGSNHCRGYARPMTNPADERAAEGRQTGRLGRPLSDCPGELRGEERRAWRAGWQLGREEYAENRAVVGSNPVAASPRAVAYALQGPESGGHPGGTPTRFLPLLHLAKCRLAGESHIDGGVDGRYWARTSDPQLVEEGEGADETS